MSGAGEFHPRALPEPDMSLSTHPAPIIPAKAVCPRQGLLPPVGGWPLSKNWMTRSLRATGRRLAKGTHRSSRPVTANHRYYGSFRPCASASVLSASRVLRLCLSLCIETTGSKVPCLSPIHARAALRPGVMPVVNRISPTLLPGPWCCPGFDTV